MSEPQEQIKKEVENETPPTEEEKTNGTSTEERKNEEGKSLCYAVDPKNS